MVLSSLRSDSAAGEEELPSIHVALVADGMENTIPGTDNTIELGIREFSQHIFGVCVLHDRLSFRFVFLPARDFIFAMCYPLQYSVFRGSVSISNNKLVLSPTGDMKTLFCPPEETEIINMRRNICAAIDE